MSLVDPLSELVTTFNFRRAIALISIILILGCTTWTVDYYTDYTRLHRLERTLSLLERLDALERRGDTSKELEEVRSTLTKDLAVFTARPVARIDSPKATTSFPEWFRQVWPKFLAGALPWFVVSVLGISKVQWDSKSATSFVAVQFLTIFFGLVVSIIPPTSYWVVDYVLVPWGLLFALAIVPLSIVSIAAYQKVRETSLQKAILNNLRQLGAAADQFFLENGSAEVSSNALIGPDKFIKSLVSVDGESYEDLVIKQGEPITVTRRSGDSVSYAP